MYKRWVSALIKKAETNCPYEICNYLKINVITSNLGSLNGYYIQSNGVGFIYINNSLDKYAQRAICAHELGHAVLHTNLNIRFMSECTLFSKNKFEYQANLFGAYLTLTGIEERLSDYNGFTKHEIAAIEYVPVEYVELYFNNFLLREHNTPPI